jgi:esterase/lipase
LEPSEVKAPSLIVLGEWDANVQTAQTIFGKLSHASHKRLVQIGEGTHLVFLENNRMQLFREVQLFLDEPNL